MKSIISRSFVSRFSLSLVNMSSSNIATTPITVKVDVVSDGVCPFCFLGKRKLDLAVQQFHSKYPNDPAPLKLDVTWHPFQLDSTMPVGKSFPTKMWFAQRFGPHWDGYKHVMKVGAQVGVKFDFDGEIGSTFDYHRLLRHVVSEHGSHVQNQLAELLFTEHFENGRSLAEHKTLLDAAVAVGLDRAKLEAFLASDAESEAVRSEVSRAKARGIRGVPDFSVEGGRWAVHGAEEPATWLRIFEKIRSERMAGFLPHVNADDKEHSVAKDACKWEDGKQTC